MRVTSKRPPLFETHFHDMTLLHRGKVRDLYSVPGKPEQLLVIATDRISAYDVVMKDPVPGKGKVLTDLTLMWLDFFKDVVPNHLITADVSRYPDACKVHEDDLWGRSMLVRKLRPLPVECIVRGYISGSLWKAYHRAQSANQKISLLGHSLYNDMVESEKFHTPLFTPSTKAEQGLHDENIFFDQMVDILASFLAKSGFPNIVPRVFAQKVADISVTLYKKGAEYAREKGIIIADTKFEFGIDANGELVLIDEVLTPDSSRFWPQQEYKAGTGQQSFDKQFLRDFLSSQNWDKKPPAPEIPLAVLSQTADKYAEARHILCG